MSPLARAAAKNSAAVVPGALADAASPVALYKSLLASHVADHLKAGKLNLAHSLRYLPFNTYLLDATT